MGKAKREIEETRRSCARLAKLVERGVYNPNVEGSRTGSGRFFRFCETPIMTESENRTTESRW